MQSRITKTIFIFLMFVGVSLAQLLPTVNGTVTFDGNPMPNFIVYLSTSTSDTTDVRRIVETDENGFFEHTLLPTTTTVAFHDTFSFVPWDTTFDATGSETYTVNIELEARKQDAVFNGAVTFGGVGQQTEMFLLKIPGSVNLGNFEETEADFEVPIVPTQWASYKAETDENGNFELGLLYGKYVVYVPGTDDLLPYWATFTFDDDKSLQIIMKEKLDISGVISNIDGYSSVQVSALPVDIGRPYRTLASILSGDYKIEVAPGEYKIRIQANFMFEDEMHSYIAFYDGAPTPEDAAILDVQSDLGGINFNLPDPVVYPFTIDGNVNDAANGNPIAGAKVTIVSVNPFRSFLKTFSGETDENGSYEIVAKTISPEDSMIAFAEANGYFAEFYEDESTFLTADVIKVKANSTVTVNFALDTIDTTSGFSISGTVYDALDGNIIPFGSVTAYTNATNIGQTFVNVDSNGNYAFDTIFPTGSEVFLQAWAGPMYLPSIYDGVQSWEDATPITIDNQDITGIDFPLVKKEPRRTPLGALRGIVNPAGLSKVTSDQFDGSTVFVRSENYGGWKEADYVDDNGSFNLPIEGYGSYDILLTAPGRQDTYANIVVDQESGLVINDISIDMGVTGITDPNEAIIIKSNRLYAAYPNPFNPTTTIRVDLAEKQDVNLVIYNVVGQQIRTLQNGQLQSGVNYFTWNGKDQAANEVSSGMYFYQLRTKNDLQTKTLIFLK